MNTVQLLKIMHEMYRDANGTGREILPEDYAIHNFLIQLYNTTELEWQEIKSLWWDYLAKGKLDIPEALRNARKRGAL